MSLHRQGTNLGERELQIQESRPTFHIYKIGARVQTKALDSGFSF